MVTCNTTVAYVLSRESAVLLQDFDEEEIARTNLRNYTSWETRLGSFLRKRKGIRNHIPLRQFGEHGGLPNPEHKRAGLRDWHEADMLACPLAFQPPVRRQQSNSIQGRPVTGDGCVAGSGS